MRGILLILQLIDIDRQRKREVENNKEGRLIGFVISTSELRLNKVADLRK